MTTHYDAFRSSPSHVPQGCSRVQVEGSLNKSFFDGIIVCADHVPSPAPGWAPPMADFMQSPHFAVVGNMRKTLIAASHSALTYAIDPQVYEAHGSAAAACAMDVVDKWNPQEIIDQFRDKIDGSGDEHEGAQLIIYMALVYVMAYDKFSNTQRQQVIDWLALGAVTAAKSEKTLDAAYEPYPRQNHLTCLLRAYRWTLLLPERDDDDCQQSKREFFAGWPGRIL